MPRSYCHIKGYEKGLFDLKEQGSTNREIGERFGITKEQTKHFLNVTTKINEKLAAGITPKKKGRPPTGYVVSEQDKVAELRYIHKLKQLK